MRTAKEYRARSRAPFKKCEAQEIGEYIEALPRKDIDSMYAYVTKDKKCLMHKKLDWDDKKCGVARRKDQLRDIVNSLETVMVEVTITAPGKRETAHPHVTETPISNGRPSFFSIVHGDVREWKSYDSVLKRQVDRRLVAAEGIRSIQAWLYRYRDIPELKKLTNTVERAVHLETGEPTQRRPQAARSAAI